MAFKTDTVKIKRWREERHWSQEHLADLAGVGLRTIQRLEKGEQGSQDTLKALAAAYNVDVSALSVDPSVEATEIAEQQILKTTSALRLSLWIHLASYVLGVVVFVGISLGVGGETFAMKWPLIWWTAAAVAHAVTVVIVELVFRYNKSQAATQV